MKLEDLRELIQDDLICLLSSLAPSDLLDGIPDSVVTNACQIVVDRFKEYLISTSSA